MLSPGSKRKRRGGLTRQAPTQQPVPDTEGKCPVCGGSVRKQMVEVRGCPKLRSTIKMFQYRCNSCKWKGAQARGS